MIITCNGCETRYRLSDEKVPASGIRVRCPKCRFVWRLMPPPVTIDPGLEITTSSFEAEAPMEEAAVGSWGAAEQRRGPAIGTDSGSAPIDDGAGYDAVVEPEPARPAVEPALESPEMKKKRDRAKRLARVFVSDILVYNKEKREHGLAKGDLMTVLGPEIKKAWEAYKEKIGSEVSESSEYFRCALNEILADGQKVF
ncbi:MAG: zinc-ribbon domain-containing protein [Candidatus Krumholzibacteria bacterium]|nr:zinc-ribbon domain-containing protein [Candidatus Krumholzibacteria bacterium]